MNKIKAYQLLVFLPILFLLGCDSSSDSSVQLGALYSGMAAQEDLDRNPVIIIPGILGSKLVDEKTGLVAWGTIGRGIKTPSKRDDNKRRRALPMREHASLSQLKDDVKATQTLDKLTISFFGLDVEIDTYADILKTVGVGGFIRDKDDKVEGIDYGGNNNASFEFAYDWRQDLVESAKQLHVYILEKHEEVQARIEQHHGIKNKDIKFNIIAHSMGGLVLRYYLRYGDADLPEDGSLPPLTWAGSQYIEQVILIAPPNGGSMNGFLHLVRGAHLLPGLPSLDSAVIGTMPSVYQLLPRARHGHLISSNVSDNSMLDPHNPELWEKMEWGLADPKQDSILQILLPDVKNKERRRQIALDHQRKSLLRAKAFSKALDVPAVPPNGLSINLISGDAIATEDVMKVNAETKTLELYKSSPGDGQVLRSSALMDERVEDALKGRLITPIHWSNVLFLPTDHLGLTKDPVFTDNILYILLERPKQDVGLLNM